MNQLDIVTVCFNDLEGLLATATSLKMQKNHNFKWLVIDGGSKDGTREYLESFQHNSIELQFISERDDGVYDAMNKAVNICTSKYIWFLNAGDCCVDENTSERILKNITDDDFLVYKVLYPSGPIEKSTNSLISNLYFTMPVCHQGLIYKRDLFVKYGGFDLNYHIASDYEHLRRIVKFKATYSSFEFHIARYQGGGLSEKRLYTLYTEILKISLRYNPFHLKFAAIPIFIYRYFKYVAPRLIESSKE